VAFSTGSNALTALAEIRIGETIIDPGTSIRESIVEVVAAIVIIADAAVAMALADARSSRTKKVSTILACGLK